MKKNNKGFTLIELIVVMAIMAILVLIAVPKFLGYTKDAAVTAMQADAKVLSNATLQYNIKNEKWPIAWTDADANGLLDIGMGEEDAPPIINNELASYLTSLGASYTDTNGNNSWDIGEPLTDTFTYIETDDTTDTITYIEVKGIKNYVKNTKNPITDYMLAISGPLEGEVFHVNGIVDSNGVKQFGIIKK